MSLKNARVIAWGFPGSFPGHFRLGVKLNEGVKLWGEEASSIPGSSPAWGLTFVVSS